MKEGGLRSWWRFRARDETRGFHTYTPSQADEAPMDRQYVGIDFHRRRSVIVRLSVDGERLGVHRIVNDPFALSAVMAMCGEAPAVRVPR